jgi:membrane protein
LGLALLLLASLIFSALLNGMSNYFEGRLELSNLLGLAHTLVFLLLCTILFAMIFKILPARTAPWSTVWRGAILTSILFTIGKNLIGLYLARAAVESAYGAAGSFMVLLIWIYYSVQIFLFGAVFTKVYAKIRSDESSSILYVIKH